MRGLQGGEGVCSAALAGQCVDDRHVRVPGGDGDGLDRCGGGDAEQVQRSGAFDLAGVFVEDEFQQRGTAQRRERCAGDGRRCGDREPFQQDLVERQRGATPVQPDGGAPRTMGASQLTRLSP